MERISPSWLFGNGFRKGTELLCHACWTKNGETRLRARCSLCATPGNSPYLAKRVLNEDRVPVCKQHYGEELQLICWRCGREVSPRAVVDDRGIIAMVGDSACGKSTLLEVLKQALRSRPNYSHTAIGDTEVRLRKELNSGRVNRTDESDANERNYAWQLVRRKTDTRNSNAWLMAFHDAAGQMWMNLGERKLDQRTYPYFSRYLDLIGAVVFFVDGEHLQTKRNARLSSAEETAINTELAIANALRRYIRPRKGLIPGAVVVSKADLLWNRRDCGIFRQPSAKRDEISARVERLLEESSRRDLLDSVRQFIDTPLQFFAVSAQGKNEISSIEDADPVRIEDPLLYVIGIDPPPDQD